MSIEILSQRKQCQEMVYRHEFSWPDSPGSGFSFDVDASGTLIETAMTPIGLSSYRACASGMVNGKPITDQGVRGWMSRWTEPAVGKCPCGRHVTLENDNGHGIDCACGAIYNAFGQRLAPREQWGEDCEEGGRDLPYGYEEDL